MAKGKVFIVYMRQTISRVQTREKGKKEKAREQRPKDRGTDRQTD